MERRLAAVLAADVVGFSRLMESDEAGTLNTVRAIQTDVVEKQITEMHGHVVKRMGDGWLAEFASAASAVNCALAIQSRMQDLELALRIGVDVGDITHIEGDIFGSGVNIATRLETIADSGGIAISADVHRLMKGSVDAEFHPNGAVELKNIQAPIDVWSWPKPLSNLRLKPDAMEAKPKLGIGALEGGGAVAVDMALALRSDLGHAFGRQTGLELVSKRKDADFVLGGSVRASGERWRVVIDLVESATGASVWTDRIDDKGPDAFEIQDRLTQRIAGSIRIRIPALLSEKLMHKSVQDLSVEELLNFAMGCNFVATKESWGKSRLALDLVLDRDPDSWMAMTMLCWNLMGMSRILGWRGMEQAEIDHAQAMIDGATRLQPNDHLVRTVRGTLSLFCLGDPKAAKVDLEEALNLNPDYYHAINAMALVELAEGDLENAARLSRIALSCDPAYPYRHLYYRDAGLVALVGGDYESAIKHLMLASRSAPGLPANLALLSAAHSLAGDTDEALLQYKHLKQVSEGFDPVLIARLPFRDKSITDLVSNSLIKL